MVLYEVAYHYISNVIWDCLYFDKSCPVSDKLYYNSISDSSTGIIHTFCPCWDGSLDLMPYWACIFEWICYSRANIMGVEFSSIESRYNDAISYLTSIKDIYCIQKSGIKQINPNNFIRHITNKNINWR